MALSKTVSIFVLCLIEFTLAQRVFTDLEIDNHPCKAENLKSTNRYICDHEGEVICLSGWRNPDSFDSLEELNPCLEPICHFHGNEEGCEHGECVAPNVCACEVGWEGVRCEICVKFPGCSVHGSCLKAFECNCESGWEGQTCDIPVCEGCDNGYCINGDCVCMEGWSGPNCTECRSLDGCINGACFNEPNTCICVDNTWEGLLCDQPVCSQDCVHGYCHSYTDDTDNTINFCICHPGWRGDACDHCRPYWHCPNQENDACNLPNECFCPPGTADEYQLCNNTRILHHGRPTHGRFSSEEV